MIEKIISLGASILIVSFLMFITFNIVKDKHIRSKWIVLSSVSFGLVLINTVSLIVDISFSILFFDIWYYFFFIGISFVYFVIAFIFLLKSMRFSKPTKKKMIYTYHDKIEYVYLFFKFESNIYVLKNTFFGIKYKMRKTEFADDVIKSILSNVDADFFEDYERRGIVTIKSSRTDDVYYCYMIQLSSPLTDDKFTPLSVFAISANVKNDLDKFIILKCLSSRDFNEIM